MVRDALVMGDTVSHTDVEFGGKHYRVIITPNPWPDEPGYFWARVEGDTPRLGLQDPYTTLVADKAGFTSRVAAEEWAHQIVYAQPETDTPGEAAYDIHGGHLTGGPGDSPSDMDIPWAEDDVAGQFVLAAASAVAAADRELTDALNAELGKHPGGFLDDDDIRCIRRLNALRGLTRELAGAINDYMDDEEATRCGQGDAKSAAAD